MGQIFEELERRKKGPEPKGSGPNSLIGSGGVIAENIDLYAEPFPLVA